ncbi:MAG TPA: acyl-CoA dehydrogenase family protein [Actinomycetota bacterium]|nr:acyl-CoA dehydrogenase family protein [Actinomycetota bacterium]
MPLLNIPEEVIELRNTLRDFIEREVRPVEDSHRQEILETGTFGALKEESLKLRKRSAELGFYTLHMPESVGGGGLSYLGQVLLHEEAARSGLILPQVESIFPVISGPSPIYMDCSEQQREKYLEPLLRADKTTCFALTEPGAGSDATRIQTKAVRVGEGAWRISGRKHFITGGAEAEFALVFAVTDSEKRAQGGITAFFVDAGRPGYSVTRVQRTMSPFQSPVELTFDDVEVTDAEILGKEGFGFYSAMRGINGARLQISARALGLARFLLDRSIEYAQQRTAFGKPIGANQFVQGMIVESHAELEQARLLVYQQAAEIDDGADGRRQAALAKMVAAEMVGRVADRAIQVHGGNGFMTELGLEGWYRDVRAMRLYEGTGEILRANVAKTLGLPS